MTEQEERELANRLIDQWDENEETMGEMAAYHVACEMLDVNPEDGMELMAKYCRVEND